jgi:hypothetical protein
MCTRDGPTQPAGTVPVADALGIALHTLRRGLDADQVALVAREPDWTLTCLLTTTYRLIIKLGFLSN